MTKECGEEGIATKSGKIYKEYMLVSFLKPKSYFREFV